MRSIHIFQLTKCMLHRDITLNYITFVTHCFSSLFFPSISPSIPFFAPHHNTVRWNLSLSLISFHQRQNYHIHQPSTPRSEAHPIVSRLLQLQFLPCEINKSYNRALIHPVKIHRRHSLSTETNKQHCPRVIDLCCFPFTWFPIELWHLKTTLCVLIFTWVNSVFFWHKNPSTGITFWILKCQWFGTKRIIFKHKLLHLDTFSWYFLYSIIKELLFDYALYWIFNFILRL